MGYFKRAITCITRKMGKSVILLLLVFILGNVIAGAISVSQSVKNTQDAVIKAMVPVAFLEFNMDKFVEDVGYNETTGYPNKPFSVITSEEIEELGALPSVNYYDYSYSFYGNSTELIVYYHPEALENGLTSFDLSNETFYFTGTQVSELMDFKMGKIELVEGRLLTQEEINEGTNSVLISKYMADLNNLSVGSTFILHNDIYYPPEVRYPMEVQDEITFEYNVVGLYIVNLPSAPNKNKIDLENEVADLNKIYASNKLLRLQQSFEWNEILKLRPADYFPEDYEYPQFLSPYYVFKDTAALDEFTAKYKDIFGNEYYNAVNNWGSYRNIVSPLQNMSKLADLILYIGVGSSLIILSSLITLFLKDRRSEIGIYLALGERITKIIAQILLEVLLVAILGITLSLFSGNFISKQLSNLMLNNAIIAQQETGEPEPRADGCIYQEDYILQETMETEFTVVGIYSSNIDFSGGYDNKYTLQNLSLVNTIYASNKTLTAMMKLRNIKEWQAHDLDFVPTKREFSVPYYVFADYAAVKEFTAQYQDVLSDDVYSIISNTRDFVGILVPLENMTKLADYVLYVGIGATLFILSLLIILFLRDRRSEIGIYIALGERKAKIIGQILTEVVVVALIGITFSLFSGNIISSYLSNTMMENEVIARQELEREEKQKDIYDMDYDFMKAMGYGTDLSLDDLTAQYDVSLNFNIILMFYIVGIGVVLLSTLIPILYVLRLNPRKILL